MTPSGQGSFRLFQLFGINVFLHWSWFLIAVYAVSVDRDYTSLAWNVLEVLSLFLIVLTHEFGHALACRQVGGQANRILLWPLGGVAYVSPPQRPGATLWSIAAGPLVNVVLIPVFSGLLFLSEASGSTDGDLHKFLKMLFIINLVLLIFNMLPIYPLDGGQILQSLLWFVVGKARSLLIASILGFVGVIGLIGVAFVLRHPLLGLMAVFILLNCWRGMRHALALIQMGRAPHHVDAACPSCRAAPPKGAYWICGGCQTRFDAFDTSSACPGCGGMFPVVACLHCGQAAPIQQWKGC